MQVVFRPIELWPAEFSQQRHFSNPFRAGYADTLDLLDRELDKLGARSVVVQLALAESEIRLDGLPRAGALPSHPGVIVSFESKHGPLRYGTDAFPDWRANLRAIALGLESLRKVDRYGIGKRGEQYAGWKALPAGDEPSVERGRVLIGEHGSVVAALKATHPDHGGDAKDFRDVQAARESA